MASTSTSADPDGDPDTSMQTVKTFLKSHMRTRNFFNARGERVDGLVMINQYVNALSLLAIRGSRLMNAALLLALDKGNETAFDITSLQTTFNHAMEFSKDNPHVRATNAFTPYLQAAYDACSAEWDEMMPDKELMEGLDRTVLTLMKTTMSVEYKTNVKNHLETFPKRLLGFMDAYWKMADNGLWTRTKKWAVKRAFLDGDIHRSGIPDEVAAWITEERTIMGAGNAYLGGAFVARNVPKVLRHMHDMLLLWEAVRGDNAMGTGVVRDKSFSLLPMYNVKRLHIPLDASFLFMASGVQARWAQEDTATIEAAKEAAKAARKAMTKEEKEACKEERQRRAEERKAAKDREMAERSARQGKLRPRGKHAKKNTQEPSRPGEATRRRDVDDFRASGLAGDLWNALFKVEELRSGEWKFNGTIKTDGVSACFVFAKDLDKSKRTKKNRKVVHDPTRQCLQPTEYEGKRGLSVDPGRKDMARVAVVEWGRDGLPVVGATWALSRRRYYEESGINRETRNKRRWNKEWLSSQEFDEYAQVCKRTGGFQTARVNGFIATLKAFVPAFKRMWAEKASVRQAVSGMQAYMGKRATLDGFWAGTARSEEERRNTFVIYGACVKWMPATGRNEATVPIKPVLKACRQVYERVYLVNEDNTTKKDAYTEEDLRKLYRRRDDKGLLSPNRSRGWVEVRGLRLCSAKGSRVSMRHRKTTCVDRDLNACINLFKAACSGGKRPPYLVVDRSGW